MSGRGTFGKLVFAACVLMTFGIIFLYSRTSEGTVKLKITKSLEQQNVIQKGTVTDTSNVRQMRLELAELEQNEKELLSLKDEAELLRQLTEKRKRVAELKAYVHSIQANVSQIVDAEQNNSETEEIANVKQPQKQEKTLRETEQNTDKPTAARYRQRLEHLQKVCKSLPEDAFDKCEEKSVKGNLFNASNDIVYCSIEKCGSTFWRRILKVIQKGGKVQDPLNDIGLGAAYSLTSLKELEIQDIRAKMNRTGNRNVVFVRDPYTRLFSGWLDKFFATNPYWWGLGKNIIKTERKHASNQSLECGHDVSFSEFVRFFAKDVKTKKCAVDGHFSPSYRHCLPCGLPYNFIGKYETLKEDTMYFLEKANISHLVKFSDFETSSDEDAIKDSTKWAFGNREKFGKCMTFMTGLQRVWKRLQFRGILNMKAVFPEKELSSVNINETDFRTAVLKAYRSFSIEENKLNREIALTAAYSTVSNKVLQELHEAFDLDFKLFDYDRYPSFIANSR